MQRFYKTIEETNYAFVLICSLFSIIVYIVVHKAFHSLLCIDSNTVALELNDTCHIICNLHSYTVVHLFYCKKHRIAYLCLSQYVLFIINRYVITIRVFSNSTVNIIACICNRFENYSIRHYETRIVQFFSIVPYCPEHELRQTSCIYIIHQSIICKGD